ncbi:hypothetical protein IFR05_015151 [Cadophora sp. M221]|nr:hypothetical protein IFR05_015151 [Cadophora sp. M221]
MALPSFNTLPQEVLLQIMQLLRDDSPSSLYSLLFLKSCNELAESVIYASITMKSADRNTRAQKQLFARINHEPDVMRKFIRHLTVEDGGVLAVHRISLQNIFMSVQNLQSFSWNNLTMLNLNVLKTFHVNHPNARLHVSQKSRISWWSPAPKPLEVDVLKSPQLYSLSMNIVRDTHFPFYSEYPTVWAIIKNSKNLRILRIGAEQDNRPINRRRGPQPPFTHTAQPLHFPIQQGDSLEPLSELTFFSSGYPVLQYDLSAHHCAKLRDVSDWSHLKVLDFGEQSTVHFWSIFRGYIPNLKTARFRFSQPGIRATVTSGTADEIGKFLDSITGLEELDIKIADGDFFNVLFKYIKHHGPTLQVLKTSNIETWRRSIPQLPRWNEKDLLELQAIFPRLRELDVDLACEESGDGITWGNERKILWPSAALSTLANFPSLRILTVRLIFPSPPPNTTPMSAQQISGLCKAFFYESLNYNSFRQLKALNFTVNILDIPSESRFMLFSLYVDNVMITIQRSDRDDADSLEDRGLKVAIVEKRIKVV